VNRATKSYWWIFCDIWRTIDYAPEKSWFNFGRFHGVKATAPAAAAGRYNDTVAEVSSTSSFIGS